MIGLGFVCSMAPGVGGRFAPPPASASRPGVAAPEDCLAVVGPEELVFRGEREHDREEREAGALENCGRRGCDGRAPSASGS